MSYCVTKYITRGNILQDSKIFGHKEINEFLGHCSDRTLQSVISKKLLSLHGDVIQVGTFVQSVTS